MLTRFISDRSYETLDLEYKEDSNIKFENTRIGVDGNMDFTKVPSLNNARDLKINNYVLNILTKNDTLDKNLFLIQNDKFSNKICYLYSINSSNTFNWESFASPATSSDWMDIAKGDNNVVMLRSNSSKAYVLAKNSKTWIERDLPINTTWKSLIYSKGLFVALSQDVDANPKVAISKDDGSTWTMDGVNDPFGRFDCLTFGKNLFLTIKKDSNQVFSSLDGFNWNLYAYMPFYSSWNSVTFGEDKFVAISSNSNLASYSDDGLVWYSSEISSDYLISPKSIIYGENKFVLILNGTSDKVFYSDDGIIWNETYLPNSANLSSIIYGKDRFIISETASTNGYYSYDGITWYKFTFPTGTTTIRKLGYGFDEYISCGRNAQFNYLKDDYGEKYWNFSTNFVSVSTTDNNFSQNNILEINFINENSCEIYHYENEIKYSLVYSQTLSSVKFVDEHSNNFNFYNKVFNYNLKNNEILFYTNTQLGVLILERTIDGKLSLKKRTGFKKINNFYIKKIKEPENINCFNNWVSYEDTYNKNNINIEHDKSHSNVSNNFLLTAPINNILSSLPVNMLTLKNQLNQNNEQSRGNVFLNENETNIKEYESIFTGGYRELGYDKINLGYSIYTNQFEFKSGKTTYFHVPHNIYPYEILNINSSKLAECGAVGGNTPLNSDKIWKKLKNYKDTTPYSYPQEELTGQWLCTWLSAGNENTRPIWVDRYYKPSKVTKFEALSSTALEIIYQDSFDCLDLKENISDVKSSMTFEKGSYYAYMHLGKKDYEKLIEESLSDKIYHKQLNEYQGTNFQDLNVDADTYILNGKTFGYIDSNNEYDYNIATFSFFLEKSDWTLPTGNQIFGNYTNNGFGFYNYSHTTPYSILKINDTTLQVFNNDFKKINQISTDNLSLCAIAGISRRSGLENIHVITKDFRLIEFDLKGTIVDSNSAMGSVIPLNRNSDIIYSITNDNKNCYVYTNKGLVSIDLLSNIITSKTIKSTINTGSSINRIVASEDGDIYLFKGENVFYRNGFIYGTNDNKNLYSYSVSLSSLSNIITTDYKILSFNIDKDGGYYYICTNDGKLKLYDTKYNQLKETISLSGTDSETVSAFDLSFCENFEYGKYVLKKQLFCKKSNNKTFIIELDTRNNQSIIDLDGYYDKVQANSRLTNYNFNKAYLNKYKDYTYNFKAKLLNKINAEDALELDFVINGYDITSGLRHFCFSINPLNGIADFYLDGKLYERKTFKDKKYSLNQTFKGRIFYGCDNYFNGIPLFKYFKDTSNYTCGNFNIKEINILNKYLDRFQVLYFYNMIYPPNHLKYNMPSGTRSFIDVMEKTFDFGLPMYKSNVFNLKIFNSGIFSEKTRKEMEDFIRQKIEDYLPHYTELKDFKWIDTVSKPVYLEGDYNVSNTLTDIL
jgi:hypothetical protein